MNETEARDTRSIDFYAGTSMVTLRLLRGFSLARAGQPLSVPMGEQRVLAFLAVNDRPLLRCYVASALWLDSSEKHALGNLRSAIWRVPLLYLVERHS